MSCELDQEFNFRCVDFEVFVVYGEMSRRQLGMLFFSSEESHELDT